MNPSRVSHAWHQEVRRASQMVLTSQFFYLRKVVGLVAISVLCQQVLFRLDPTTGGYFGLNRNQVFDVMFLQRLEQV